MLVRQVVADFFETNCWIIAKGANQECLVVDPGISRPSLVNRIKEEIQRFKLKPVAIVVTHGHLDHTYSVLPLSKEIPMRTYISKKDKYLLQDPYAALQKDSGIQYLIDQIAKENIGEPSDVYALSDVENFEIAGMKIESKLAPGHTAGSMVFEVESEFLISGDVLFAGAIGRTDLPTGSMPMMKKTLKNIILKMTDELNVLPGHGVQTTIAEEKRSNPYLQPNFLDSLQE
jgi:glyoxylase-like metal-dependent hydrolase (beta-lactamase superfamily II)